MLMLGYDFLEWLSDKRSQSDPNLVGKAVNNLLSFVSSLLIYYFQAVNQPIFIVCHSLGGVVVKQALCVASNQDNRYGPILNAMVGVIFLSTPHRYGDKTTNFIRFQDIVEAMTGREPKISNTNAEQEMAILLDLANRFNGTRFFTPVLSVYEMREWKSSTTLRPRYQQVSFKSINEL